MSQQIPKLLFIGAGNIAQSIIKGIIRSQPNAGSQILATAPTSKNLNVVKSTLGCRTTLLNNAFECLHDFKPDYVFLCVKPQVLMASISEARQDTLSLLLRSIKDRCTTLSFLAGVKSDVFMSAFDLPAERVVRVMLNTAAEIGSTSVLYHAHPSLDPKIADQLDELFGRIGRAVVRLNDESLMDVATGICGSGIAFFYEMIQTISDIGVKNGLNRADATLVAAQLSKAAGEMILEKRLHPYQLRDEVTSPAGTTIYGIETWHENATGPKISQAFQTAIDRAKSLSKSSDAKLKDINEHTSR